MACTSNISDTLGDRGHGCGQLVRVWQEPGNRTSFRPAFLTIPPPSCGQLHPSLYSGCPLACDVLSLLQIGILVALQAPPFLKGHLSGGCTLPKAGPIKEKLERLISPWKSHCSAGWKRAFLLGDVGQKLKGEMKIKQDAHSVAQKVQKKSNFQARNCTAFLSSLIIIHLVNMNCSS